MPFFEVNPKYLQFQSETETYRFIQDPQNRISIHIWQTKPKSSNEPEIQITRFQVATESNILEWKNSHLSFGDIDSGDNGFGIKKSPVMMMSDSLDQSFIKKILPVLKENVNIAGMTFLISILEKFSK